MKTITVELGEERNGETEKTLEKYGYLHKDEVVDRLKNEWSAQFGDLNKKLGEIDGLGYMVAGFVNSAINKK